MKTADIRTRYLDFFVERGHQLVPSSSLVPGNDPTLLFTNSGMVQFKDALIGIQIPSYRRATSAQRCVRAGGKHNDLENVGYTARHHTFFEMMGNFSFGDYFKEETIRWAWTFVTEVLDVPRDRLWVTVHPEDAQSRALWIDAIGFRPERVVPIEANFWAMGDTGPCGPCTEIFYDHGPAVPGGPPGSPDEDGDRFVEFWNLVFPQFDRSPDGTLTPLAKPGVDTGMGLERVAAIKQGVHDNYEIDVFRDLMRAAAALVKGGDAVLRSPSLRVIADHIRSCSFLVADGVTPSNEDRGYVLRRIIRRALRHGNKLGLREPFFHKLVAPLAAEMGAVYPVLAQNEAHVVRTLLAEEERFAETLSSGMELLEKTIRGLSGKTIPGDVVFRLYDTYGFPTDLTADVARERGLSVDMSAFEVEMERQRERGRAASHFAADVGSRIRVDRPVTFLGYEAMDADAEVLALYRLEANDVRAVDQLEAGEAGIVVLDRTPFYAESGGQVGDTGVLCTENCAFRVDDTTSSGAQHLHRGTIERGALRRGARVSASVQGERRRRTASNHSATHLMHAALRNVLGTHVQQKGSLVDHERLRFDFSHGSAVTEEEIARIEALVNQQILANTDVTTEILGFDDAVARGAMALFGEKYGERVRVLTMGGGFSVELCGGTHVRRTGDIGLFKIVSEGGIAAGVRRIEAVSGAAALEWVNAAEAQLKDAARALKAGRGEVVAKVRALLDRERESQKEIDQLKARLAARQGSDLADTAEVVNGVKVLTARIDGVDAKGLLATLDTLKSKLGSAAILLAHVDDGGVNLIAGVTSDLTARLKAGDVIKALAPIVGARGGGRPDMARAGGGDKPDAVPTALAAFKAWVAERVISG
jgi:alanyl-tRNA synthetase